MQGLAVTAARDGTCVPYALPMRTSILAGALPTPEAFLDGLADIPDAGRHRTRDRLRARSRPVPATAGR